MIPQHQRLSGIRIAGFNPRHTDSGVISEEHRELGYGIGTETSKW
jgi:hypothetical protein